MHIKRLSLGIDSFTHQCHPKESPLKDSMDKKVLDHLLLMRFHGTGVNGIRLPESTETVYCADTVIECGIRALL